MREDQEFWIALVVYGGILFSGLLVVIGLVLVGLALKKRLKKETLINEITNVKERKNGQHKSVTRGKF